MQQLLSTLFKGFRKMVNLAISWFYSPFARLHLYLNGADVGKGIRISGFLKVHVTRKGRLSIGNNFHANSGNRHNLIGRQQKTILWVDGKLHIGNNVGMSSTAIICNEEIIIGDNVMIGGNTVIYDSDFHSLNPTVRLNKTLDRAQAKRKRVQIEHGVFVGAHSTILKGVTIGEFSVIGAGSVVTCNVPAGEVWAGNPARFIKKLEK